MRILAIGGTGFIGRVVVAQLRASSHDVATFSRCGDIQGDRVRNVVDVPPRPPPLRNALGHDEIVRRSVHVRKQRT